MKGKLDEIVNPIGFDKDYHRTALAILLLFSLTFLVWHGIAEYRYGIIALAVPQLLLALYSLVLLYFVWHRPYAKHLALAFLVPLISLLLAAMAHPDTPVNVFIWVFLIPVLCYSFLGQRLGLLTTALCILLAMVAYRFHYTGAAGESNPLIITDVVICLAAIWVAMHLYERNREITTNELRRMATTDELTGLYNRRQIGKVFAHLTSAAERNNQVVAVVVLDLDHFKQINDRWGHHGGDQVLVHIAQLLGGQLRGSDWAFRVGGEEFCLLLPMKHSNGALAAGEMLRRQIAEHPCDFEGHTIPLSASIGIALSPSNGRTFDQLLSLADERMYRAKQQGRNRVVGDDTPPATTASLSGI